jgi:hypothetical protein
MLLADLDVLVVWVSEEVRVLRLRLGDLAILLLLLPVAEAQALPAHQPRQMIFALKKEVGETGFNLEKRVAYERCTSVL